MDKARSLHYAIVDQISNMFAEGNPGGVKEIAKLMNICDHYLRLPLVNVSADLVDRIKKEHAKIEA